MGDAEVRIEGDSGRVGEDALVLPEFDAVIEYVNAAIRDGLADPKLQAYLDRMGFDLDAYEPVSLGSSTTGGPSRRRRPGESGSNRPSDSNATCCRTNRSGAFEEEVAQPRRETDDLTPNPSTISSAMPV